MKRILDYLEEKYAPEGLILYGSYQDGSQGENSDFDCLVITTRADIRHDTSTVDGVVLDAFLYHPEEVAGEVDCRDFVQIYDGTVFGDTGGIAAGLLQRVRDYVDSQARKTREELQDSLAWCEKMLHRTRRRDPEGYYRWHWLLQDSLEIYCDIRGRYDFGPKKSLRFMEQTDPESFRLYGDALAWFTGDSLERWIDRLKELLESR